MWTSTMLAQECLQVCPLPAWLYWWPYCQHGCWGMHSSHVAQCTAPGWALRSQEPEARECELVTLCTAKGTWCQPGHQTLRDRWPRTQLGDPRHPCACTVRAQMPRGSFARGPSSGAPAPAVILWFNYCITLNYFKDLDVWNSAVGTLG